MNALANYEKNFLKNDIPEIKPGDIVRVNYKIKEEEKQVVKKGTTGVKKKEKREDREKEKERIQPFQGIVVKIQNTGLNKSFTVRKISYSVGVERTFPFHSPNIESIKLIKRDKIRWRGKLRKVRRSKLYYLREETGKGVKV